MTADGRAGSDGGGATPQERAAFRAFVREHHPDRGGDPEVFVRGLARFRPETRAAESGYVAGAAGGAPANDAADDARWDAPVEIVTPLPMPVRVAVALIRTVRWHRHRRVR